MIGHWYSGMERPCPTNPTDVIVFQMMKNAGRNLTRVVSRVGEEEERQHSRNMARTLTLEKYPIRLAPGVHAH